ncbi:hypothetical protein EX30DRAFT_140395 [Ascodesmis nigricans]|uniref:Uncharacterized protein n=1 Tax=Ascodesmis nigricans TaxID=341454 RepID=A0A4S2N0W9_9PEZI|nr:hypothetical protein EX30DRAFT_140395 [Ascodesmis nigricans]
MTYGPWVVWVAMIAWEFYTVCICGITVRWRIHRSVRGECGFHLYIVVVIMTEIKPNMRMRSMYTVSKREFTYW